MFWSRYHRQHGHFLEIDMKFDKSLVESCFIKIVSGIDKHHIKVKVHIQAHNLQPPSYTLFTL